MSLPSGRSLSLQLEWRRGDGARLVRPLVVIIPWVWADGRHVEKFVDLVGECGWGSVVATWPMAAMWFPAWARWMAGRLVSAISEELDAGGERPVVFYAFSGAPKGLFSSVLSLLAGQQPASSQAEAAQRAAVLRCCVGCIFDSSPVDFTSDMGRKLLSPEPSGGGGGPAGGGRAAAAAAAARGAAAAAARWGIGTAAGALDFFLLERFDQGRDAMWSALRNCPVRGPMLFCFSRSDDMADAAQIGSLAAALRLRGRQVLEQVWQDSPHCGHLRQHPEEYADCVRYLLAQALQEWSERSARLGEGRRLAARWQDAEERPAEAQQQQQQLVLQPARGVAQQHGRSAAGWWLPSAQPPAACASSGRLGAVAGAPASVAGPAGAPAPGAASPGRPWRGCNRPTTGCCCSGRVLAAVTAAAASGAASQPPPGWGAAAEQQQSTQHLTPLVLLQDTSAAAGRGRAASAIRSAAPRATRGASGAGGGAATTPASISTCCGCAASECRCAETLAAASGEVVCEDTTTLSHSLRCMASGYLGRAAQQQQQQQQRRSAAAAAGGVARLDCAGGQPGEPGEEDRWQQQQRAVMLQLQHRQQEQPFVQRVVTRLRSRL